MKPKAVTWNQEKGYSRLIFGEDDVVSSGAPSGEYLMRGGLAFPMLLDDKITIRGYAIMCGLNVKTGVIYVFEEFEYFSIDNIIEDNKLLFEGLAGQIPIWWKYYFADSFFVNQDFDTKRKYSRQLIRSYLANPSPRFLQVHWKNEDQPIQSIYEKDAIGKLIYRKNGVLFLEMEMFRADSERVLPALHALKCAITGIEKYRIANIR